MIHLHLADCTDAIGLRGINTGGVDHVIMDPPYSKRVHDNQVRLTGAGGAAHATKGVGYRSLDPDLRTWVASEAARVARRWIAVFSDFEGAIDWVDDLERAGATYVRTVPWIKVGAQPQMSGDRPANAAEYIVLAHSTRTAIDWNGGGRALWYHVAKEPKAEVVGQKPLDLMIKIVDDFTLPGETILDPFAGMATTLVAARMRGRDAIGMERDATTHRRARARLARTESLLKAQEI